MPSTPQAVVDLVERFDRNRDAYHAGRYNETQLRREFLDPFFEALGWDVTNRQGYAGAGAVRGHGGGDARRGGRRGALTP